MKMSRWINRFFTRAQVLSAAYMGYAHGHNDAQKTMGIIALTLFGAEASGALDDLPGEDFVYEAQLLLSAARELGMRVVSVPIESRYRTVHSGEFRQSHFRVFRDLWKITSHVVAQAFRYGNVLQHIRLSRENPPVIDDTSGEFGTVFGEAAPQTR